MWQNILFSPRQLKPQLGGISRILYNELRIVFTKLRFLMTK